MCTPEGIPAGLTATTAAYPGFPERVELVGSRATAQLQETSVHVFCHDGAEENVNDNWQPTNRDDPMDFPYDAHLALITDFIDAIDDERKPRIAAKDALKTQRLIDSILEHSR